MNIRAGLGECILQTHNTKKIWRFNKEGWTPVTPLGAPVQASTLAVAFSINSCRYLNVYVTTLTQWEAVTEDRIYLGIDMKKHLLCWQVVT